MSAVVVPFRGKKVQPLCPECGLEPGAPHLDWCSQAPREMRLANIARRLGNPRIEPREKLRGIAAMRLTLQAIEEDLQQQSAGI